MKFGKAAASCAYQESVAIGGAGVGEGSRVTFCLADVFYPLPKDVCRGIYEAVHLGGIVQLITRGPVDAGVFAVVNVQGVTTPLVVPMDRIQIAGESEGLARQEE